MMGFLDGDERGGVVGRGFRSLMRRKQVDSDRTRAEAGHHQLAKELSIAELIAIGVGSTIGAGVYVLVGTVAREHSGPALTISFLIAGIAAALSAFCYAELASRCPSAGSAYHYSYICVGEGIAWLIGWALILEYTIGGAAVARGITPNLSSSVQATVTTANVCVMLFVIIAGGYIGFQTGWVGYKVSGGYFPYGVNGMFAGSATVFFAYIGFDTVASTAEEVKNPQRDLPIGIGTALSICCLLYMMVSIVIVGLVPYFAMDPDTPISSAFAKNGMQWAMYIVTAGAILALCSTLLGSLLPQPRILMAMARDGLLPPFFSDVNKRTQVPVKGTILTGVFAAALAFFMDVSQLAGMVSVGTLLAFTIVAISILILRYVPPTEVPLPSSFQESIHSVSSRYNAQQDDDVVGGKERFQSQQDSSSQGNDVEASSGVPLVVKETKVNLNEQSRRMKAACSIACECIGIIIVTASASYPFLPLYVRIAACALGGLLLLGGLAVLSWIDQDDGRHSFGHSGGFICPFVPLLPTFCILINAYLLINLGGGTWMRVSIWLLLGVFVYIFYGRRHSSLTDVIYVPLEHADEIYKTQSSESVA